MASIPSNVSEGARKVIQALRSEERTIRKVYEGRSCDLDDAKFNAALGKVSCAITFEVSLAFVLNPGRASDLGLIMLRTRIEPL